MPNWCRNHLIIDGPEEAISKIAKACRVREDTFDFEGIVPMPRELDITSGSSVSYGLDVLYGDWQRVANLPTFKDKILMAAGGKLPETREDLIRTIEENESLFRFISLSEARQARSNQEKYGFKDWYGWRNEHWGTKWNACDVDVENVSACNISVWFNTAWSPPIPVVEALCSQYPEVSATLRYIETGCWFAGTVEGRGGVVEDIPADDVKAFGEEFFGLEFEEEEASAC